MTSPASADKGAPRGPDSRPADGSGILGGVDEPVVNATLESRLDLNERYAILRVRPDARPAAAFVPGQFIHLGLPQPVAARPGQELPPGAPRMRIAKRSYSIASSADDRERLEFFLTLVSGGRFTPELWQLAAGGRCWIAAKAVGSFTLDGVPADKDLVMVGTGTGISPYVSMLRTFGGKGRWRRFVMIHGVRRESDLGYRSELEARERTDPSFRYVPVVSREPGAWKGAKGRVQSVLQDSRFDEIAGMPLDPRSCRVFLCGNPDMIRDVRSRLAPKGFDASTVHVEKYW
jgi:ferredoxin--NADP+ reductase